MEFLENLLCPESWHKASVDKQTGFLAYNIRRTEALGEGRYRYSILDDDGHPRTVTLDGAPKGNPLKGVANCDLIVQGDVIMGLNIDGHCVMRSPAGQS